MKWTTDSVGVALKHPVQLEIHLQSPILPLLVHLASGTDSVGIDRVVLGIDPFAAAAAAVAVKTCWR